MKIRTDFVSNSSSSSFILKDVGFFKYFGITKQDIYDALVELYGGQEHIDKPFCVYDMTDEKEREECFKEWDSHFENWYAPNEGEYDTWNTIKDTLTWKCNFGNIYEILAEKDKELRTATYDRDIDKYVYKDIPGGAAVIKHIKNCLKVKTMKEVLHDKHCTLMIHFDDNEVYNIKGMSDYGKADAKDYHSDEDNEKCKASAWDSENYSADRFFEILIKYFINKGKIDLTNPDFLVYWEVRDDDTWFKKNHPNAKYYLEDGKATWKDVVDDCLNCNAIMHEG